MRRNIGKVFMSSAFFGVSSLAYTEIALFHFPLVSHSMQACMYMFYTGL